MIRNRPWKRPQVNAHWPTVVRNATWRRPRSRVWVDHTTGVTSIITPLTSKRVWYKPWTWKIKRYPHSTHIHMTFLPKEDDHHGQP